MSSSAGGSAASASPSPYFPGTNVPRVGGVRCYWALVTPSLLPHPGASLSNFELTFVHPDPVLAVHLARQKVSMMGRGVIEFIHPAEREQARKDLAAAIAADDLQGSVTRVRFARLSRIRVILGCPKDEVELPYDASTFVEDDEYLILDLVLNWVADGLLLAFFHAIRDKDPVANNDPHKKDQEWSNFCGTAVMGEDQIEALHHNISSCIPLPPPSRYPPTRVFQLHTTPSSPVRPASLVFSWPPPRPPTTPPRILDGLYDADEYADLMRGVDMDPAQLASGSGSGGGGGGANDDMRTNCTTRFGAKHSISSEGVYRHIDSVFIPYGSLIFACFQTTKLVELNLRSPDGYGLVSPQQHDYGQPPPRAVLGQQAHPRDWSRPPQLAGSKRDRDREMEALATPDYAYDPRTTYPPPPPPPPASHSAHSTPSHSHSHPASQFHTPQHHQPYPTPSPGYPGDAGYPPPPSSMQMGGRSPHLSVGDEVKAYSLSPGGGNNGGPSSASLPSRSPGEAAGLGGGGDGGGAGGGASSRPMIRPPGDVECCTMCGTRESPEWRRSESGIKDLCNACGLRLARQVAKREGRQKPRKKKEKAG